MNTNSKAFDAGIKTMNAVLNSAEAVKHTASCAAQKAQDSAQATKSVVTSFFAGMKFAMKNRA